MRNRESSVTLVEAICDDAVRQGRKKSRRDHARARRRMRLFIHGLVRDLGARDHQVWALVDGVSR